jgi:hypothetical protein
MEGKTTDLSSYELPVSLSACLDHIKAIYKGNYLPAEMLGAIEETHRYIEKQMQMKSQPIYSTQRYPDGLSKSDFKNMEAC